MRLNSTSSHRRVPEMCLRSKRRTATACNPSDGTPPRRPLSASNHEDAIKIRLVRGTRDCAILDLVGRACPELGKVATAYDCSQDCAPVSSPSSTIWGRGMKILAHAFTMIQTNDLEGSVAAYVGGGLEILWRPDPQSTLIGTNGRAFVMVEDDSSERALGAGPVLLVDDLSEISLSDHDSWAISPIHVPVGRYAAVNYGRIILRCLDLSTREESIPTVWFGDSHDEQRTGDASGLFIGDGGGI